MKCFSKQNITHDVTVQSNTTIKKYNSYPRDTRVLYFEIHSIRDCKRNNIEITHFLALTLFCTEANNKKPKVIQNSVVVVNTQLMKIVC